LAMVKAVVLCSLNSSSISTLSISISSSGRAHGVLALSAQFVSGNLGLARQSRDWLPQTDLCIGQGTEEDEQSDLVGPLHQFGLFSSLEDS
jgi:hypothetical protein